MTPNFTLSELTHTDRNVKNDLPPGLESNLQRLAELLEQVRALLGNHPIRITSGFRSAQLNAVVGGVRTSAHLYARAADFVPHCGCGDAFSAIKDSPIPFDQLILEPSWIHISIPVVGTSPRRQTLIAELGPKGMVYRNV